MNSRTGKSAKHKKGAEEVVPGWLKSRRTGMLVALATGVGAITGAIIGLINMGPIVDPFLPATHAYIHEVVDEVEKRFKTAQESTGLILRDIQIEQAQGKLDATKDAQAKWTLEKQKTQDKTSQDLIDGHLKELDRQAERLVDQVKTLRDIRAKEH